jgi:hypothetical protein
MYLVFAFALSAVLLTLCTLVHYEALRITGRRIAHLTIRPRQRVLVVIFACLGAHLIEILLYGLAFALVLPIPGLGAINGSFVPSVQDFFYFAVSSYTTLGVGDVFAVGPLRVMVATAALNGFLMITWSASFTYLVMQRYWHPER